MIRSYSLPREASRLEQLRQRLTPAPPDWFPDTGWVAEAHGRLLGYLSLAAVEGLPDMGEIWGGVLPACQRQGVGGQLLAQATQAARGRFGELSAAVTSLQSPAAHFLSQRGFALEHEEVMLTLAAETALFQPVWPPHYAVLSYLPQAKDLFCLLYDQAFRSYPWYQPFDPLTIHIDRGEVLFLHHHHQPIGLAWAFERDDGVGQIEPFGLIPAYQGRGLARPFLLAALHHLRRRGVERLQIGAWRTNRVALGLYRRLGFGEERSLYYLSCPVTV